MNWCKNLRILHKHYDNGSLLVYDSDLENAAAHDSFRMVKTKPGSDDEMDDAAEQSILSFCCDVMVKASQPPHFLLPKSKIWDTVLPRFVQ